MIRPDDDLGLQGSFGAHGLEVCFLEYRKRDQDRKENRLPEPRIIFLLDLPERELALYTHCCFEVGMRLGQPFLIRPYTQDPPVQSGAINLVYSARPLRGALPAGTIELPCAFRNREPALPTVDRSTRPNTYGCSTPTGCDLLAGVAHCLQFKHESSTSTARLDGFGRLPLQQNEMLAAGLLEQPWIDQAVERLAELYNLPPASATDALRFVVTHDVDGPLLKRPFVLMRSLLRTLTGSSGERDSLIQGLLSIPGGARDPYLNFEEWCELGELFQFSSTFFLYPGSIGRAHRNDPHYSLEDRELLASLRRALERGSCEVGLHSGIHTHSAEEFRNELSRLGQLGLPIPVAHRAHYWSLSNWLDPYEEWFEMHKAGIRADLSLSPLGCGYRFGSAFPLTPSFRVSELQDPLIVLPSQVMDAYVIDREPDEVVSKIIGSRGVLVMDWHVRTFWNQGPYANYLEKFVQVLTAIRQHCDGARSATVAQCRAMWLEQIQSLYLGCGLKSNALA